MYYLNYLIKNDNIIVYYNNSMNTDFIIKNPLEFIKKAKKKEIIDFLIKCDEAFFNTGQPLVNDDIYDIIKDYIKSKYPKDKYLKRVGADEKNKVLLPYYMGSQNKIKDDEEEIKKYSKKYHGPYIISHKLDGVSCLIHYKPNKDVMIYTRGNGKEGQNISHIIDYVKGIPKVLKNNNEEIALRGELIISRKNWEKIKNLGANARNVVSGAINSKIINKNIMNNIEFVSYELIKPKMKQIDALEFMKKKDLKVVEYAIENSINLELLSKYLKNWRNDSDFEIDGIVISDNEIHNIVKDKNPEYSFAFKSIHTHEQVEVIVTDILWNISKDKYIKPIVKFNEIDLNGVKIKQASGFNAGFITKNKLGAGSHIIIIRSGDVIPHILEVLTPSASGEPDMPDIPYIWNDTGVDILLSSNEKNRDHDIKEFTYFMKALDIQGVGPGIITKLYDAGFDSIKKIFNIKFEDIIKIEGFKEKSANNVLNGLSKIHSINCLSIMDASNIFGRGYGERKLKTITDKFPFILNFDKNNRQKSLKLTIEDLITVNGIAEISAKLFIDNLPKFYKFYDDLNIKCNYPIEVVNSNSNLKKENSIVKKSNNNINNKGFIFTGFRNKDYEKKITDNGGIIKTSISKNLDYVIVANKDTDNTKVKKAQELGIKIIDITELEKLF